MFSNASADETTDAATPADPALTLEQVRAVFAVKSRKGFTAEIRSLLHKYGADKLPGIAHVNYKALLEDAEVLGHCIAAALELSADDSHAVSGFKQIVYILVQFKLFSQKSSQDQDFH